MTCGPDAASRARAYDEAAGRFRTELGASFSASPEPGLTALDLFRAAPLEAPAVFYFDTTLTYADIDHLSDRLAGRLAQKGVRRGDRIAIILQNVPQFLIASVAAWKLGAIVVSLNPMYRTPELRKLFKDCEPKAVICHDDQWDNVFPATGSVDPELVFWTSAHEFQTRNDTRVLPALGAAPQTQALALVFGGDAPAAPALMLSADDVGLLLYTSGTTGVPKGAMLTHRNLVAIDNVALILN